MKNLIVAIVALAASVVCAGTKTWKGGASGDWNVDQNWEGGVPGTGDTAVIADASVNLPEAVSIYHLDLSGTVTLSGEPITLEQTASQSSVFATGGTYTFNNKIVFKTSDASSINGWSGKIYLKGGLQHRSYFIYGSNGELHIQSELDISAGGRFHGNSSGSAGYSTKIYFDAPAGKLGRMQLASDHLDTYINTDDPWDSTCGFDLFCLYGGTRLHLQGHSICAYYHMQFGIASSTAADTTAITTDAPAELQIQETKEGTLPNVSVNLTGPLTVHMLDTCTDGCGQSLNRTVDSTGGLIVDGGFYEFMAGASWPNLAFVKISGNGKVRIAAGKTITVPALYLGGSDISEPEGTYGAAGGAGEGITPTSFIEGEGVIVVARKESSDTEPITWTNGGADISVQTAANWQDGTGTPLAERPELESFSLLPTFGLAGTAANVDCNSYFKGLVFDAPGDFALVSAQSSIVLGSLGLTSKAPTAGTRDYAIDAAIDLRANQEWNLASGTTVTVSKVVSGQGGVTLSDEGALVLSGDNTFSGNLTINRGVVDATGASYALGRANGADYTSAEVYLDQRTATLHLKDAIIEKNIKTYGAGNSGNDVKLTFEGTNVLKGDYLTFQGDYPRFRPNAVLKIYGKIAPWGYSYFAPKSDDSTRQGAIYAYGPVVIYTSNSGFSPQNVQFHFCTNGCHTTRYEICNGGTLHFDCPFVDTFADAYVFQNGYGDINLHGNSQIFGCLYLNASLGAITSGEEGPATMFIHHTETGVTRINTNGDLAGQLSVSMGGGGQLNNNKALSTAGDLTVTNGTWNFMANGSWLNGTNFTASGVSDACKGRITVAQSKTFGKHAIVHLDGKGVLELGDGVSQRVRELWINGVEMPSGTYGSSQSAAQHKDDVHFAGTGVLRATGGGMMLILR